MKCKAAKLASLGTGVATGVGLGNVGTRIGGLHHDTDYEASGTRYVRDP